MFRRKQLGGISKQPWLPLYNPLSSLALQIPESYVVFMNHKAFLILTIHSPS